MGRKIISAEQRDAVAADLAGGMTRIAAAQKHDLSYVSVSRIDVARLNGTLHESRRSERKQLTTEQHRLLIADYLEGVLSGPQLAKKYGVPSKIVNEIAKKAGVARAGNRSTSESPVELLAGAWIYGKDGIARWVPGAVPQQEESA